MKNLSKTFIFRKTISLILALCTLFYVLPLTVFADSISSASGAENEEEKPSAPSGTVGEIIEMTELREEGSKTFRLEDGSYLAAQYKEPVHYLDGDGKWQDIDNTLAASGSEYATSDARIKFTKKVTGGKEIFTLQDGNKKITLAFPEAKRKTVGTVYNGEDGECETELQKKLNLEKLSSRIVYENILEGTDIEYVISSGSIKENIIVKESRGEYSYTFELSLNNLSAALCSDGSISITDKSGAEVVYTIPAPIVFDATGSLAPERSAHYTLESFGNGKYELTVTVDAEWMNSAERVYPITVDPTLSKQNGLNITDTYISSSEPSISHAASTQLRLSGSSFAYINVVSPPAIPENAYITNAELYVYHRWGIDWYDMYVGAYEVKSRWTDSITYNSYLSGTGRLAQDPVDYTVITTMGSDWYSFDLTELARKWYRQPVNYGVALKPIVDPGFEIGIVSSEFSTTSQTPYFTVSYVDMKGVEPYYSYLSQSAGAAGSGSVNLASGKLTFSIPLLSTTDSLMPITLSMVYNSDLSTYYWDDYGEDYRYAYGFMPLYCKLNISETLLKSTYTDKDGVTVTYYVLWDSDGTEHAFMPTLDEEGAYSSTEFLDEDGLLLKLTVDESTGEISVTDTEKTERTFLPVGNEAVLYYLSSIADRIGNKVVFSTDSSYRPTSVSLVPKGSDEISFLSLTYNASGKLIMVRNPAAGEAVVLRYSGNMLISVLRVHGSEAGDSDFNNFANGSASNWIITDTVCSYTYDYDDNLVTVTDELTGYSVNYGYTGDMVSTVWESVDGTPGQQIGISYSGSYTKVRASGADCIYGNEDDLYNHYAFDIYGRAIYVYTTNAAGNEILGGSRGEYETQENVKNNIKSSAVVGGVETSYIRNGTLTRHNGTSILDFNTSSNVSSVIEEGLAKNYRIRIMPGVTDHISQTVTLSPGKYAFAVNYTPYNCTNATARLEVSGPNGFLKSENIELAEFASVGSMAILNFEVSDVGDYTVRISATGSAADSTYKTISVESLSLTKNIGASKPSYVEAGHADEISAGYPPSYYWKTEAPEATTATVVTDADFGNVLRVDGDISKIKYLRQVIYSASDNYLGTFGYSDFSTNAGKEYELSAFAKAENAIINERATFRISIEVVYQQEDGGTITVYFDFDCNGDVKGWQYINGTFDTKGVPTDTRVDSSYDCVKEIAILCEYSYQPSGYALFDEISVVECDNMAGAEYRYNEDGLLSYYKTFVYSEEYTYYEGCDGCEDCEEDGICEEKLNEGLLKTLINSDHEYFEYVYSGGLLVKEIYYTYELDYSTIPPRMDKTARTVTEYTYNELGLCTQICCMAAYGDGDNTPVQIDYSCPMIYTETEYETSSGSKIFGAVLGTSDYLGRSYKYFYDENNGRLLAEVNTKAYVGTAYEYDDSGRLISVMPAVYSARTENYEAEYDGELVEYEYTSENRLDVIHTESTEYSFVYDAFGNTTEIWAGGNLLASYEYFENNGGVKKLIYGNGFSIEYEYDALDNLCAVWYNDTKAFEYEYTKDGVLAEVRDILGERRTSYSYDGHGRLTSLRESEIGENVTELHYSLHYSSDKNIVNYTTVRLDTEIGGLERNVSQITQNYTYHSDERLESEYIYNSGFSLTLTYSYDEYKRLSGRGYLTSGFSNTVSYEYESKGFHGETYTGELITGYVSEINSTEKSYTYEYDKRGNITAISLNGSQTNRYVYDDIGQLIREDDILKGKTLLYTYDNAGNISSVKTYGLTAAGVTPSGNRVLDIYSYSSSEWGDLLMSYNGEDITYDGIGNPISYYNGFTFSWQGRRLVGATRGSDTLSFTYNDDGIRTSKTVNCVTTTYYLSGSLILAEVTPSYEIMYIYDASGSPISMQYRSFTYANGVYDVYFFEKNLQGDILAVYGADGTKYIEYTYDAWGNFATTYHNGGGSTSAVNNRFTYRCYYYDSETGFYLTGTRYYDPEIGRFINADGEISDVGGNVLGYNLFAYCFNNPVNMDDPTGQWPKWIGKAIAVVAVAAVVVAAVAVTVPTFGAGSVAGVAAISAAVTIAARATEVAVLQVKKSKNSSQNTGGKTSGNTSKNSGNSPGGGGSNSQKSNGQVAVDVTESLFDNGLQIIGITPFTKAGSIGFNHILNQQVSKIFWETTTLRSTLSETCGKVVPYALAAYEWYNTTISIFSDDPVKRAEQRGYTLK